MMNIAPGLEALLVDLDDLTFDPHNARTHDAKNLDAIKASLERFGQRFPVVVQKKGMIIRAGNGRVEAARALGWDSIAAVIIDESNIEAAAFALADNRTAELADWDDDALRLVVESLGDDMPEGWDDDELADILETDDQDETPEVLEDDVPEKRKGMTIAERGDVWQLGEHKIMCGDSTDSLDVATLLEGVKVDVIHADPPYGMGKEADGVLNDNLRNEKLDAFQLAWLKLALAFAHENAGLYIWGNPAALWRFWFLGGLEEMDDLTLRNEIVWNKGVGFGMKSGEMHSYSIATERCLFLMRGKQFARGVNKEEYSPIFEPLRLWLCEGRDAMEWTTADMHEITGNQMSGHWFGRSQFYAIKRGSYDALRYAAGGGVFAFELTYDELVARFPEAFGDACNAHARKLAADVRESRSYFDNEHESMTDVWEFPRVQGDDRHGHATPKPVKMIARALRSSCPTTGVVFEPFLGTGTTLIAAEQLDRTCYGMELDPAYVDVVIERWQNLTGQTAQLCTP